MKTELENIYKDITYTSMNDALLSVNIDDKVQADVLELGDDRPVFFTGELIVYKLTNHEYSGVILDIYIENDSVVYLIVKRLGAPQLHDVLVLSSDSDSAILVIFDAYSTGMHTSEKCDLDFGGIMNIITYNTGDVNTSIYNVVADAIDQYDDMLEALDEVTNTELNVTIH